MHHNATLFFKITIGPQVVISCKKVHLYPTISEFTELSEKTSEAFWHNITILIPKVKHISEQVNCRSFVLDTIEKTHQPTLLRAAMCYRQ